MADPGQLSVKAVATKGASLNLASDVVQPYDALYIGTTGDVKVDMLDYQGNVSAGVLFKNVAVGFFPVKVTKVYSTANGTTASQIVGLNW